MGKFSLIILLFLIGTASVFGDKSGSSCEEGNNKELVCSEEVKEAINREAAGLPPVPPKGKILDIETTAAPATKTPPKGAPEGAPEGSDKGVASDSDYYYVDGEYDEY